MQLKIFENRVHILKEAVIKVEKARQDVKIVMFGARLLLSTSTGTLHESTDRQIDSNKKLSPF